jgi:hypothetical protein
VKKHKNFSKTLKPLKLEKNNKQGFGIHRILGIFFGACLASFHNTQFNLRKISHQFLVAAKVLSENKFDIISIKLLQFN